MRSAHCALPSDRQPKIQPAIATFSASEFHRLPALSDNTVHCAIFFINFTPRSDQYINSPYNNCKENLF